MFKSCVKARTFTDLVNTFIGETSIRTNTLELEFTKYLIENLKQSTLPPKIIKVHRLLVTKRNRKL